MIVTILGSRKNLCGGGTVDCGGYPNLHVMKLYSTIYTENRNTDTEMSM